MEHETFKAMFKSALIVDGTATTINFNGKFVTSLIQSWLSGSQITSEKHEVFCTKFLLYDSATKKLPQHAS